MRQMHVAFRQSQKMTGLISSHCHLQRIRIGHTHVFTGKSDQSSCDIERILATVDHPVYPVNRRVRIGIPHGFMERGNQVIVFLPAFVIEQGPAVHTLRDRLPADLDRTVRPDLTV